MDINKFGQANPQLYTDLNQLQSLKAKANSDEKAALKEAAQQFEQLFLSMMLKSMREANAAFGEDNIFNSSETELFQEMLDQQSTLSMAKSGGIGLADVLVRQLSQGLDIKPTQDDDDEKQNKSDTEQMLNRAFDSTANAAASAMLGRIYQSGQQGSRQEDPTDIENPEGSEARIQAGDAVANGTATDKTIRNSEPLPGRFESPEQFVEALLPLAEAVAGELGVDPKVLLAQAALETGWGRFITQDQQRNSYNLFNIKTGSRWEGDQVRVSTLEYNQGVPQREMASFRAYDSYEDSFRDYVNFLKNSPRYQIALEHADNPARYLQELQAAGYATDPAYADKIERIFSGAILAQAGTGTAQDS
ncbi:flagellar assembly peptidoglycan hydrolase FlgJ [Nitrincola alkalilacustris]|uniref:flagellar assembly peptidoglycan hydrolase FlgJ n=1 Tax=Nitrincola alkalilacustris TaxID=1571224 RepID=UPI00124BD0A8|nr:flagellar assembly peptidoglycan hydrolase FlgJ [Nitrincola alkalilacustris]